MSLSATFRVIPSRQGSAARIRSERSVQRHGRRRGDLRRIGYPPGVFASGFLQDSIFVLGRTGTGSVTCLWRKKVSAKPVANLSQTGGMAPFSANTVQ